MTQRSSDLRRVVSATGIYAAAAIAQRGLAFVLLPVYTRVLEPRDYGILELLNGFSAVVFACLLMGLPSAIQKCYHRDCRTAEERSSVLVTAAGLGLPTVLFCGALLAIFAGQVSRWLIGTEVHSGLVELVAAGGVLSSVVGLILANLRAEERAVAFVVVSLTQFLAAISLNVVLVVHFGLGVRGVLWSNLVSNAIVLPLAVWLAHRRAVWRMNRRLISPLLKFGLLLIPVILAGWVMDLSDRYVLRLYGALDEVGVYAVGYRLGLILQVVVVWPFQLAWPSASFALSKQEGHRETYAKTLTYLALILVFSVLGLAILSRIAMFGLVGEGFRHAYKVVPLVALAYAFNGVQYCVSPGVHLSEKTRYLPPVAVVAALLNLGLNFALIPRWGMMGAAWATGAAFLLLAIGTGAVAQRFYPVKYEYGRLAQLGIAGLVIFLIATRVPPENSVFSFAWHLVMGVAAFPMVLVAIRFFDQKERAALNDIVRHYVPFLARQAPGTD